MSRLSAVNVSGVLAPTNPDADPAIHARRTDVAARDPCEQLGQRVGPHPYGDPLRVHEDVPPEVGARAPGKGSLDLNLPRETDALAEPPLRDGGPR